MTSSAPGQITYSYTTDPATRRCSVAAPAGAQLLPAVVRALDQAHIAVEDITLRRPTLDEVFLSLTGRVAASSPTRKSPTRKSPTRNTVEKENVA